MSATRSEIGSRAAIVGIGATEFSKDSGRSELQLALECVKAALDDAGLAPADVDGMATFTMDNNPEIEVNRSLGGGDLRFFSRTHYGGGAACAPVLHAAMAVATGVADVVVCYRAMNERSQQRFGVGVQGMPRHPRPEAVHFGWHSPYGLLTPASWVAMNARRYMHEFGATTEDFGRVSVAEVDRDPVDLAGAEQDLRDLEDAKAVLDREGVAGIEGDHGQLHPLVGPQVDVVGALEAQAVAVDVVEREPAHQQVRLGAEAVAPRLAAGGGERGADALDAQRGRSSLRRQQQAAQQNPQDPTRAHDRSPSASR